MLRYIQDMCTDHVSNIAKNVCETLCVVLFIYVSDVFVLFSLCLGVAYIVNIEAKRFCKVVEAIQFYFLGHLRLLSENGLRTSVHLCEECFALLKTKKQPPLFVFGQGKDSCT